MVNNPFAPSVGCSCALNIGDLNFLTSLIVAKPKVFLDELQEELPDTEVLRFPFLQSHKHFNDGKSATKQYKMLHWKGMNFYEPLGKPNMRIFQLSTVFDLMRQVLMISPPNEGMVRVQLVKQLYAVIPSSEGNTTLFFQL